MESASANVKGDVDFLKPETNNARHFGRLTTCRPGFPDRPFTGRCLDRDAGELWARATQPWPRETAGRSGLWQSAFDGHLVFFSSLIEPVAS